MSTQPRISNERKHMSKQDDARDRVVENILELDELGKRNSTDRGSSPQTLARSGSVSIRSLPRASDYRTGWERQRAITKAHQLIPPSDLETRNHRGDGETPPPQLENLMNDSTAGSGSARLGGSANWAVAQEASSTTSPRTDLTERGSIRSFATSTTPPGATRTHASGSTGISTSPRTSTRCKPGSRRAT